MYSVIYFHRSIPMCHLNPCNVRFGLPSPMLNISTRLSKPPGPSFRSFLAVPFVLHLDGTAPLAFHDLPNGDPLLDVAIQHASD